MIFARQPYGIAEVGDQRVISQAEMKRAGSGNWQSGNKWNMENATAPFRGSIDQGPQAAHPGVHARNTLETRGPLGRSSGS